MRGNAAESGGAIALVDSRLEVRPSPMRNSPPLGPYSRTMPRTLWGLFLMSEVPLYGEVRDPRQGGAIALVDSRLEVTPPPVDHIPPIWPSVWARGGPRAGGGSCLSLPSLYPLSLASLSLPAEPSSTPASKSVLA